MEGRTKKYGQTSPERSKVWTEPPPPPKQQPHHHQQGRKIPVVYYLCRNRHLEHPHFIEVPISSSQGLYLRDVISRLNVLRGKGMAAMYSWSCKRSYKNGFVWHDLSEDDLILAAQGNEYVLKGSELLDHASPSDRSHHTTNTNNPNRSQNNPRHQHQDPPALISRSQETSSSSSSTILVKESKPRSPPPPPPPPHLPDDELSPGTISPESKRNHTWGSSDSPPGYSEYMVYKPSGSADASTQTEDRGGGGGGGRRARATCTRGISTEDEPLDHEINREEISPPPTSSSASSSGGKTETLESLIRADARRMNSFRILEGEEILVPTGAKLKATNVLLQLITCGSISVKDHHSFGLVPTYKPRFSHMKFPSPMFSSSMLLGELDCLSENPRLMGLRLEDKEYFSGSLIETKKHKEEAGEVVATLKRSSSYNADRSCKPDEPSVDRDRIVDATHSKCLPRTMKITSSKQFKSEMMKSPLSDGPRKSSGGLDCSISASLGSSKDSSKRITDAASLKGSSMRLESFNEGEKIIKIEERLTSGARVIIQSRAPCNDSEDSSSS